MDDFSARSTAASSIAVAVIATLTLAARANAADGSGEADPKSQPIKSRTTNRRCQR
jgi:hypothetical protein